MDCFLDTRFKENDNIPVDRGRKSNVHKTFRRGPGDGGWKNSEQQ